MNNLKGINYFKMVSQEELFDFFQKAGIELQQSGYPILDNIIHCFPGIKWEEEMVKDNYNNLEDSDLEIISDEDIGNNKSEN